MKLPKQREARFGKRCVEDLRHWDENDPKKAARVRRLIDEACENHAGGTGQPKPLREDLAGCWSRRIDRQHRLVYELLNGIIRFLQARFHYT